MPDDAADFDDEPEPAEGLGALLPPEDRIWRHPSELGALSAPSGRGFLPANPGRPGSWTAGLAGALLAAGIVLVATHLASSAHAAASARAAGSASTATTTASITALHGGFQATGDATLVTPGVVGKQLATAATRVYKATVLVSATHAGTTVEGAGLVIGSDCLVIAPAHLVGPGDSITLTLPDGKLVAAQVLGVDAATGVAVLRCAITGLATVPGDEEAPKAHELVVLVFTAPHAVGMSVGLVTAVEQRVATGGAPLLDELETDIPVSHDGAALIDGDGEVVGMVVGSITGGSMATPTWLALAVAREIVAAHHVGGAWLGVAGSTVSPGGRASGVKVLAVEPHGAAAKAGIHVGDVVESVAGHGTDSMVALQAQLYTLQPGARVVVAVRRSGKTLAEHATLATVPATPAA